MIDHVPNNWAVRTKRNLIKPKTIVDQRDTFGIFAIAGESQEVLLTNLQIRDCGDGSFIKLLTV